VDEKKLSVLQKIARMKAAERVKAAFSGGRDERMILIRDGAKVVQNAVLASPKLTEPEVETFAAAKNVSENVLREIARNRRFMKNYSVVRNLVNNPKCPLDLSLTLIKNLMVHDLKSLRANKSVPETIRQVAFKLYREKSGPTRETKRGS
jgi:PP-loop superfamily ATP-utilizing enzyme